MRVIFITGGAGGIGRATARAFAEGGDGVFLFDASRSRLRRAIQCLRDDKYPCGSYLGDVRSRKAINSALDACESELGPVDVLINHAGIGSSTHLLDLREREWRTLIETNLSGVFRAAQETARRMVARKTGIILNMASSGAIAAEPGHVHYAASKAAILALTRAIAHELGPLGVKCNALCPGDVASYEWDNVELAMMYRAKIALGRSASPEEIAAAYRFLASEGGRALNGVTLVIDGGMLAWE